MSCFMCAVGPSLPPTNLFDDVSSEVSCNVPKAVDEKRIVGVITNLKIFVVYLVPLYSVSPFSSHTYKNWSHMAFLK